MTGELRSQAFALTGGTNSAAAFLNMAPGEVLFSRNYEASQVRGYRRVDGYVKYDGRYSTSAATVPGSGPVRGIFSSSAFGTYAFRDNAGGTACLLHKATASGWQVVTMLSYIPFNAGTAAIAEGASINNGSGATAVVRRVVVSSGSWGGTPQASGRLYVDTVVGTWAATNAIKVGATTQATATAGVTATTLLPGGNYECLEYNFYGASNKRRIYGCDGVNPAFEFDGTYFVQITTGMLVDKPNHIAAHRNALFLSYPGGSVQNSSIGEPLTWNVRTGASDIGIGSDVTGMVSFRGATLAIFGQSTTHQLYGTPGLADFELKVMSLTTGAYAGTASDVGGTLRYLSAEGLHQLATTQQYGDFVATSESGKVRPTLAPSTAVFAYPYRNKDQYRLVMNDKTAWYVTYFADRPPEFMRAEFPVQFVTAYVLRTGSGEVAYVGDDAGNVYVMDYDPAYSTLPIPSFDGVAIDSVLRLPFNFVSAPAIRKRFHRVQFEMQGSSPVTLTVATEFDYANLTGDAYEAATGGASGLIGQGQIGTIVFGAGMEPLAEVNVCGVGRNMGLIITHSSTTDQPFTLVAADVQYSTRGIQR